MSDELARELSDAAYIADLEAEVARLSRRPDLTPEQCADAYAELSERWGAHPDAPRFLALAALRAASDREAMER